MTDHSQLVKARDHLRAQLNSMSFRHKTTFEDCEYISVVLDAIDALQARVAELEVGKRDMHRRAQRAEGAIFRCREWMRLRDEHLAQDRSEFVRQGMANFYMMQMAKPIRRFIERKA